MGDPIIRPCPTCDSAIAVLLGDDDHEMVYECVECGAQLTVESDEASSAPS